MTPKALRLRRVKLGMTRPELAKELCCSVAALRKWESGPEEGRSNEIPAMALKLLEYIEREHRKDE